MADYILTLTTAPGTTPSRSTRASVSGDIAGQLLLRALADPGAHPVIRGEAHTMLKGRANSIELDVAQWCSGRPSVTPGLGNISPGADKALREINDALRQNFNDGIDLGEMTLVIARH